MTHIRHNWFKLLLGVACCICIAIFFALNTRTDTKPKQSVAVLPAGPFLYEKVSNPFDSAGYIAHALGAIDGETHTNTLEAFNEHYKKGFRYFEADFVRLKDGTVLVAHDGMEDFYGLKIPFKDAVASDVAGLRYKNKHTLMDAKQFVKLVRDHPDVYVVIDTKAVSGEQDHVDILKALVKEAKSDSAVLDRLVPDVSTPANAKDVRAVYPFKHRMLALYRLLQVENMSDDEIITYAKKEKFSAVLFWKGTRDSSLTNSQNNSLGRFYTDEFHQKLRTAKIPHYVHGFTITDDIMAFRVRGIGVYSEGAITLQ